ncbi:hypothetical protein DSO57_1022993 [Entomophthora muscae]|uniref:Uncharacterized protein n=1 Tax=Entomophthora muscae TaxID=34485 RepID=A0ACC2U0Z6_9FUNG|nr:hypothetical protein DSO57_1022993 [Entomophthora muscae]
MNPEDLLIDFTNEDSPKLSETKTAFGSKFLLGNTTDRNDNTKKEQSKNESDSLLYQPWWSQPQATSYPGSGTQSPLVFIANQQNTSLLPNSPPQHTVQEDKEILIRKILAHQEVLKSKIQDNPNSFIRLSFLA